MGLANMDDSAEILFFFETKIMLAERQAAGCRKNTMAVPEIPCVKRIKIKYIDRCNKKGIAIYNNTFYFTVTSTNQYLNVKR
jgi:hypothetical protein